MSGEMKKPGDNMPRRHALKVLGTIPAALTVSATEAAAGGQSHVHLGQLPAAGKSTYVPKFFTEDEWKMANLLADMIIPRDEGSGSASEAGAVEYIDEYAEFRGESVQTELRGGFMWLERECLMRF